MMLFQRSHDVLNKVIVADIELLFYVCLSDALGVNLYPIMTFPYV